MDRQSILRVEPKLGALEQDYRQHFLSADISQACFILTVTAGALLLTSFIDLFVSSVGAQALERFWIFGVLASVTLGLTILLRRVKKPVIYDRILLAWILYFFAVVLHFRVTGVPTVSEATIVLLAFGSYTVLPNRLAFRTIPSMLITLGDAWILICIKDTPPAETYSTLVAYVGVHVVGIWSSSNLYTSRRRQFEAQIHENAARNELERLAGTDSLTNVLNRRRFQELVEKEFRRHERYHTPFAIIVADLDYYKRINDSCGHPVGDAVLKRFSRLLVDQCRDIDFVGRLGGDEFIVLLPDKDLEGAKDVARRLVEACSEIVVPTTEREIRVTASIGVTVVLPTDSTPDDVIRRADTALYKAKENGRNRIEFSLPTEQSELALTD